jgi:hypothetical protein
MCFKKVHGVEYWEILFITNCDPNHRYYALRSGEGVLRISKKPDKESLLKLVLIVASPYEGEAKAVKEEVFTLIRLEQGSVEKAKVERFDGSSNRTL